MATAETELFDSTEFKVDFPPVDGKEVTDLVLRFGGALKLNRNDPEHARMIESFTLGRFVTLTVSASVDSKGQSLRLDGDDNEVVTSAVGLKVQAVLAE